MNVKIGQVWQEVDGGRTYEVAFIVSDVVYFEGSVKLGVFNLYRSPRPAVHRKDMEKWKLIMDA